MKKLSVTAGLILTALLVFAPCVYAQTISAERISCEIQNALPTEFGYVDNTEYLMKHEFSSIQGVCDSHIVVCAEATNFSEFGVFYIANEADIKPCVKQLNEYLKKRKMQFQSGVVYNVEEYPKFENAKAVAIGRFVIYTILAPSQRDIAIETAKNLVN